MDLSEVTERLDDPQGTIESLHREIDAVASAGSADDQDLEIGMGLAVAILPGTSQAEAVIEGGEEQRLED